MSFHNNEIGPGIHVIHNYTYANAAARLAATGFLSTDVGKVAFQQDTEDFYVLQSYSPITWGDLTATGGGGGVTTLNSLSGALNITAGSNITVTPSGSNIQIASTGGGGGSFKPSGALMVSNTANAYNANLSGLSSSVTAMTYTPSIPLWVAVDNTSGGNDIATSTTGTAWSAITHAGEYLDITSSTSIIVAVGNVLTSSSDGITWTNRTDPNAAGYTSIVYNGTNLFVTVSASGTVATSPDGVTWTARTPSAANIWNGVAYSGSLYVAVGSTSGTANQVMTSPDGITWTARTSASNQPWSSVTYGNGLFVAINNNGGGGSGTNRIMTSPDGITWTGRNAATGNVENGTYPKVFFLSTLNMFVAYSNNNFVIFSFDGINWTTSSINAAGPLDGKSLAWDPINGQLIGGHTSVAVRFPALGNGWNT